LVDQESDDELCDYDNKIPNDEEEEELKISKPKKLSLRQNVISDFSENENDKEIWIDASNETSNKTVETTGENGRSVQSFYGGSRRQTRKSVLTSPEYEFQEDTKKKQFNRSKDPKLREKQLKENVDRLLFSDF
jgi:hypothetical protein